MPVHAVLAVVAVAASVVQGIQTAKAQKKSARAQQAALDKRAEAEKEQGNIRTAEQQIQANIARRRQQRERRIQVAAIQQQAVNQGAGESSGEVGATGALNTSVDSTIANQQSGILAARGINTTIAQIAQSNVDFNVAQNIRAPQTFGTIAALAGAGSSFFGPGGGGADIFSTAPNTNQNFKPGSI